MSKVQTLHQMHHMIQTLNKGSAATTGQNTGAAAAKNAHFNAAAAFNNGSLKEAGDMFKGALEKSAKTLESRQMSNNINAQRGHQAVGKIEQLNILYQQLGNQPHDRLQPKLKRLKDALKKSTSSSSLMEEADNDAARCDVLLRMTMEQAEQDNDSDTQQRAQEALDNLHKERGGEVRAGRNTAPSIAEFTNDPKEKQAMRDIYYRGIVHDRSASALFNMLSEKFNDGTLSDQASLQTITVYLRTLQRALSDDIAALAPSMTPAALGHILGGLSEAGGVSDMLGKSSRLLKGMAMKLPVVMLGPIDLTRRLLNLAHNGVYNSDFSTLGKDTVGDQPPPLTLFFNRLLPMIHQMPDTLWQEKKTRETALDLLRSHLTELSELEIQQQQYKSRL